MRICDRRWSVKACYGFSKYQQYDTIQYKHNPESRNMIAAHHFQKPGCQRHLITTKDSLDKIRRQHYLTGIPNQTRHHLSSHVQHRHTGGAMAHVRYT